MTKAEIRKLDREFSVYIRSRGVCQRCGDKNPATHQTSHIFSRRYLRVRFEPDNALCLCAKDHWFVTLNPPEHVKLAKMLLGGQRYDRLCRRRFESPKGLTVDQVRSWWK